MSALALRGNYELQMPNSFVNVDRDEMEYVDGGGTISFTLTAGTIAGMVAGGVTRAGVTAALVGIDAQIGAAIVFGTAGAGTIFAAAAVTALGVAIPWLAGLIVQNAVNGYNKSITINLVTSRFAPNFNLAW